MIGYLEAYAASFAAPVREGVSVTALRASPGGGYELETSQGPVHARAVIVATGAYQRPTPSSLRDAAPQAIFQQHTAEYRNPASLPDGAVLVVGSGQSGCQVAEDLLGAGRTVYLSVGACPWVPRSHRGRDLVHWMAETGLLDQTVDTLTAPNALVACNPAVSGTEGGHDCNPLTLMDRGAVPVGRLEGFRGGARAVRGRPRRERRQGHRVRGRAPSAVRRARRGGAGAGSAGATATPGTCAELDLAGVGAIVWATGFRPDYGWIELPVLDASGRPLHRRGVTDFPGLAFLGVHWLHKRKSSLFIGVGEDAAHVVSQVAV